MPEAPIHEDGNARALKHEVRAAREILTVQSPSPDARPHQTRPERPLGGTVPGRPDCRHGARPDLGADTVHGPILSRTYALEKPTARFANRALKAR
jgi:hypothetical protein